MKTRFKIFKRTKLKASHNPDSNVVSIFDRYSDFPIFTSNSWGGFQSSPEYWKSQGLKTILVSDEKIDHNFPLLFDEYYPSIKNLNKELFSQSIFFIRFTHDQDALIEISHIISQHGRFVSSIESIKTPYRFFNKNCYLAMKKTWEQEQFISHLSPIVHENLCEALEITKQVDGIVLEIGVYKGGSALTILNYLDLLKGTNAVLYEKSYIGIDTFNGFNYDTAKNSADLIWYKTHELFGINETINSVHKLLSHSKTSSKLVKLDICSENLPAEITKISMVNIDVDMYEPTKLALLKVSPLVQLGGIIVVEDATATPALYGASLALSEFYDSLEGQNYILFHKLGQIFLFKIKMH